ncbi:cupin domain-containing protein [Pleurocapsa sp. CCALA 161]|uniref:cupin domain-containing protein n=1 Tax=Pleurocapsa sp. CCALA 161 TaxID=2107688 RepID=UPI000D081EAF|nr:cupin domain-containing protein [Pleurocapsa sp. CCALA 161]PSB09673.1 cupin domain-containing protein [Pleurocapsa sp. CCALA 161]
MNERCMIPVIKALTDYQAYRISPNDTNRLAIVFDPSSANDSLTVCVEIFEVGSETPPHRHNFAIEMFFILKGEGIAVCDGKETSLHSGDSVLMPKTGTHYIKNTGSERLYALCMMVPNEDFSELIRNGIPTPLDEQDLKVLSRIN